MQRPHMTGWEIRGILYVQSSLSVSNNIKCDKRDMWIKIPETEKYKVSVKSQLSGGQNVSLEHIWSWVEWIGWIGRESEKNGNELSE